MALCRSNPILCTLRTIGCGSSREADTVCQSCYTRGHDSSPNSYPLHGGRAIKENRRYENKKNFIPTKVNVLLTKWEKEYFSGDETYMKPTYKGSKMQMGCQHLEKMAHFWEDAASPGPPATVSSYNRLTWDSVRSHNPEQVSFGVASEA